MEPRQAIRHPSRFSCRKCGLETIPPPPGIQTIPNENPQLLSRQAPLSPAGEPLILHADDLDVRKVFELLGRQAKVNILISPNVTGRVTLDLRDMSVEEAVQAVASVCHLTIRREKGLIYVSTTAELEQGDELPLHVYSLNYVAGARPAKNDQAFAQQGGVLSASPESESGIKSNPDKAGANTSGSGDTLIVQDYDRVLKAIDRLVAQLDVQPVQILIEAVILTVQLDDSMDLGINFSVLDGAGQAATVVGSGSAINAAAGFLPSSVITSAGQLVGTSTTGLAEDVPGLKFGFVAKSVTGFVRALQTVGKTEILACPRLLVVNKQRAELQLGNRLGYMSATQTQTSTVQNVQFMDVGTQLRLRPFVVPDGIVRMEIHPEQSTGQLDSEGIPQTTSAQVTTNVMVPGWGHDRHWRPDLDRERHRRDGSSSAESLARGGLVVSPLPADDHPQRIDRHPHAPYLEAQHRAVSQRRHSASLGGRSRARAGFAPAPKP